MTILLAALAICESGDLKHPLGSDRAIGKSKEVSRFQITPSVWKEYTVPARRKYNPRNKKDSSYIAYEILSDRMDEFEANINRDPTPEETYALWHRPGKFRVVAYNLKRMPKTVQSRCERFAAICRDLEAKEVK